MNSQIKRFVSKDCVDVAQQLIGLRFYAIEADGARTGGTIVETEAYSQDDKASHSYNGQTKRNAVMFGPAGHMYVYFTYGMHWCANIATGPDGHGEAVLLRSILPEYNRALIKQRRNSRPYNELTNGPAKLCQALDITGKDNGVVIDGKRFVLEPPQSKTKARITATKRIGIKHDTGKLWRFVATNL